MPPKWDLIERGLQQRIEALNLFLTDVYGPQKILNDGVVPRYLIETSADFRKAAIRLKPPKGIWCHVTGTDLVRNNDGTFHVLEDNALSLRRELLLENRQIMKRTFPRVLGTCQSARGRLPDAASRDAAVLGSGSARVIRELWC